MHTVTLKSNSKNMHSKKNFKCLTQNKARKKERKGPCDI